MAFITVPFGVRRILNGPSVEGVLGCPEASCNAPTGLSILCHMGGSVLLAVSVEPEKAVPTA